MKEGINIDDPMDGYEDAPDVEVDELAGTVNIKEQDTPENPPEEPAQPEESTPPETPVEAEDTPDPVDAMFKESGLDKYFNSPDEAFKRYPDLLKWSNDLSRQNAEYKKQLASTPKEKPPEINNEEFYDNPQAAFEKMYASKEAQLDAKINGYMSDVMTTQSFIASKSDFYKMQPKMAETLQQYPDLAGLPTKTALEVLYNMTKATQIPEIVKDTQTKAGAATPNKKHAETATSKPVKQTGEKTLNDWVSMTPEEIEKEIGVK